MAIFSGKSRESEDVTNGRVGAWQGLAMITDDYTSDAGIIIVAVLANCECSLTRLKRGCIYRFCSCTGASPGGPRMRSARAAVLQGSSRRSGRLPALPYPPLEQMGCLELVQVSSRRVFPVSLSPGSYRAGKGNDWRFEC
jgi:hypothetical protein